MHRDAFFKFLFRWIYYCHSSKSTGKETGKTQLCAMHRGAFCQFLFRWFYYYGSNGSTGKETGKTHVCAMDWNHCDVNQFLVRFGLTFWNIMSRKGFIVDSVLSNQSITSRRLTQKVQVKVYKMHENFRSYHHKSDNHSRINMNLVSSVVRFHFLVFLFSDKAYVFQECYKNLSNFFDVTK